MGRWNLVSLYVTILSNFTESDYHIDRLYLLLVLTITCLSPGFSLVSTACENVRRYINHSGDCNFLTEP